MRTPILAIGMTVLLFASSHGTADEMEKAVQKELAQMQGLWCRGQTLEFSHSNGDEGQSRPLDELEKSHRIQGNKWIMVDDKGKATGVEKIITLDVSSNPKKIQLTTARKGRDGKPDVKFTEYGIYELKGDSLIVHYGLEDPKGGTKPAPKQFLQQGNLIEGVRLMLNSTLRGLWRLEHYVELLHKHREMSANCCVLRHITDCCCERTSGSDVAPWQMPGSFSATCKR